MLRKLTPDELNQLEGEGYDTSGYKGELVEFPDPPKASVGAVAGRSALANALPATAGAAGFAGGMAGGAALGAQLGLAGGPFAPVTVPAMAIGSGIVGGMLASAGTRKVQDMLTPQAALDRLAQDAVERPVVARAGEIGASLLTMRPSLSVTKDAIKGIAQLPAASVAGSKAINTLNPAYRSALANVGLGAGISGATDAGLQLAETGEIDPGRLATETLIGAALNKPTALGRKVMRLPAEAPARTIDNPEALRQTMGRVVPPAPPAADAHVEAYRQSLAGQQQFNESAIALAQESIAKQEALNTELERVKQTQAELADATAAALEEARYSRETLMTPKEAEVNTAMQEQKIPRTPSKQFSEVTGDLLRSKNISVEQSTSIPEKGVARLGGDERKVIINPEKATSDTIAHEGQHYEITEIEKAATDGDSKAKKFLSDLYSKQKESLDAYNKKLVEAGQTPVDAHEFATTEQGAEFLKQQLNLKKETEWRKWWNDTKALWSQRFGKIPSTDDLQRALNYRFVNRTGEMGTIGKYGPLGNVANPNMAGATAANVPFEREATNREDYWKKRRAAAAAERAALGFPKGQELTMVTPPSRKQPLNNITEAQAKDILHYAKQSIGNVLKRVRAGTDKMPFLTEEVKGDISLDIYNEIATKGLDEDGIVPTVQRIAGRKVREYMKMKRTEMGARSLDATVGEEGGQTAQDKTADTVDTNKGFTREDAITQLEETLDTLMASDDVENPDAHEARISAVERALEKVRKMPGGSQVDETAIFSRNSEADRGIEGNDEIPYNHEYWLDNFGDYKQGVIDGKPWVFSNKNKGIFIKDGDTWYEKTLFARNPDGSPATIQSILKYGKAIKTEVPNVIEFLNRTTKTIQNSARNSEPNRGIPRDEGFNTKEGDDVLSSNEDIEVRDLTNLTPGEKLAKNRLPFLNDDSVRVTVNNINEIPEAGYVQIDEFHPKLGNTFSSNPESMNKIGYKMPSSEELKTLPNGQYTLKQAKEMLASRNSEDGRGILRDTILHTVRSEEDIPDILKNGLRRGTNVSLNGDQPNQSLGSGVTLVYNKGDIIASEKGYNPGDGLVDRQTKVKPKAILVEVGDLIEQPPITSEQALNRLNKLQALQEQERNNTKEAQKKITENYNKILDSIIVNNAGDKLTLSTLNQQSTVRGVYNPLKGYSPEQTNIKPGITKEYSITEIAGKPWLVHNRTHMSVKDADTLTQRAKEHFAETYLNEKNPLDYNHLTSDWRKSRKYDAEIDQLFEQLDKMEREGVNSLPGFTADDYVKSLNLPSDIPVYSYVADEDGNATNIRPTSRNSEEGRGLQRDDTRPFMLSAERVVRDTMKGAQNSVQALNTIKNKVPPGEWAMLQEMGIETAFQKGEIVKPEALTKWLRENEPKVEVRKFGQGGMTPEQSAYNKMTHEWYDQLGTAFQRDLNSAFDQGWNKDALETYVVNRYSGGLHSTEDLQNFISKGSEYLNLRKASETQGKPAESSHWQSVAPKPESKMKDYVEIAVVRPVKSDRPKTSSSNVPRSEWTREPGEQFPSSHNFPPNTLGFVRGYMENLPNLHSKVESYASKNYSEETAKTLTDTETGAQLRYIETPDGIYVASLITPPEGARKGGATRLLNQVKEKGNVYLDALNKDVEQLYKKTGFYSLGKGRFSNVEPEKVFHVIEVQSDWAQKVRQLKQQEAQGDRGFASPEENQRIIKRQDDPLLAHYERLALKSAIEHARANGAKRIAIQDAESAMLMEGHDKAARWVKKNFKTDAEAEAEVARLLEGTESGDYEAPAVGTDENGRPVVYVQKLSWKEYGGIDKLRKEGYTLEREGGMNLHYKNTLPSMLKELTGSEGEKVSFGEHKMAVDKDSIILDEPFETAKEKLNKDGWDVTSPEDIEVTYEGDKQSLRLAGVKYHRPKRKDLIFRNPDGSPKTDITALSFPLESVKGGKTEPFSYFEKRSSEAGRGLQQEEGEVQPFPVDNSRKSFFRPMESTFDKVERISVPHAQAARNYEARKDQYTGLGNVALDKLSGFDRDAVNKVIAEHRRAYRDGVEPALTGVEDQAISQTLKDYYGTIADIRRNLGIRIGGREAGKNEYYVPDMLNAETLDMFINKPTAPETMFRKNEWAQYVVDQSDGKITLAKAKEDINEYVRALNGGDNNYLSLEFGAIRRAAGYGLPESMRDPDAINALARYNRRAAADLAFFQEIQSKPEIAGPLLVKNQHGGIIPGYKDSQLPQSPLIQNMMQWITGNVSGKTHKQPKLSSVVRLVNNALLGPATGVRDLASVPVNSLPYIDRFSDLGAAWRGLMDVRKNSNDALRFAARQPSIDRVQFDEVLNAPDRFSTIVGKVADALRKYQGREYLENLSRDITFSMGKELGRNNVLAAKAGDTKAKNWLSKFSDLIDGDVTQLQGEELEAALNQIGKNFTDRNQGTYGGRGLPLGVVDSQFAPFLSLQKWSIEKSNVIYKDVYKPFITGENRLPLLTYTLGSLMTGAAIQQLNTLMSGRKTSDPTVKEALAKGDAASITHELATLMQLGSHAGIMSDGLKTLADMGIRGKTPRNVVSFPTATAAVRTAESVSDMLEALRQGEDPWEVLKAFTIDTAVNNVQSARILANHTWKEEDLERSDKFRDRRIFNELEGKPTKDFTPTNPYLNMDEKKFKRTADMGKAAELAPGLVKKAIEKAEGNPVETKKNLRSLKGNSYQTVPNPQENPVEFARYYKFLIDTQGQEEADRRIEDYAKQSAINKMKSRLIP